MRDYLDGERFYIIRANDKSTVEYNGEKVSQMELAAKVPLGDFVKTIKYYGKKVRVYANEVAIKITRDAYVKVVDDDGKIKRIRVIGDAVNCRFVVERLVDEEKNVVATWMLLSNLKKDVTTETIALWYYFRWKIESFFKLLKSFGFNLEKWQQETSQAIFKRLLIVSYVSLLIWKLEHSNDINAQKLKLFLVKISGRLVKKEKISTSSSLLTGLWIFLSMMDIIILYDLDQLTSMKNQLVEIMGIEI